jgi:hypothetical protein
MTVAPKSPREFTIYLRIPAWSRNTVVEINGEEAQENPRPGEYLALRREWKPGDRIRLELDVRPRVIAANPLVRENAGRVAVQRGPLVYAMEGIDQRDVPSLFDAELALNGKGFSEEYRPDMLGGVLVLKHAGRVSQSRLNEMPLYAPLGVLSDLNYRDVELVMIPYYTFANREPTQMQVWTPYSRNVGN